MRRKDVFDSFPDLTEDQKPEIYAIEERMVEVMRTGEYTDHEEVRRAYDWDINK